MPDKKTIDDLREDCECVSAKYCPLEELVRHAPARLYEQHKVVEMFKWEASNYLKRRVDWKEAYFLWCDLGFAKKFSKVYHDGMLHKEIWQQIEYNLRPLVDYEFKRKQDE